MTEPPCDNCTPQAVNDFYNIFPYIAEGDADHWKTVQEFWTDGGGDCEDFAIAKYHALKDRYDVKILVAVHHARGRIYGHAVVLLDGVYILDINPPYFYTYRQFIDYWTPLETYDAKGVQYVIVPEEGFE